jgi:RNA polymerase-binding transcription factor DksA
MEGKQGKEDIRQTLEQERSKLLRSLPPGSGAQVANPDSGDLAVRYDRGQRQAGLDRLILKQLAEIDAALKRLEAGTYGDCTRCGGQITRARLLAAPQAPLCLDCQRKREKLSTAQHRSWKRR